jgi:predicted RNA polymerase sigma factor
VLKVLFAYTPAEVSRLLGVTEEVVRKRITRARSDLMGADVILNPPGPEEAVGRLHVVNQVLRELFEIAAQYQNQRLDCRTIGSDASRMAELLLSHPRYATEETRSMWAAWQAYPHDLHVAAKLP